MRGGVAVGWLTIDDDDNIAVWFLAHLAGIAPTGPASSAASVGQSLEEHGDDAERYV